MNIKDTIDYLTVIVGNECIHTDIETKKYHASDLFFSGLLPVAVIEPDTREILQKLIYICNMNNVAVIPRGAGLSYSAGYVQNQNNIKDFILIDTRKLNKIIKYDPQNLTITVESGCTWETIMVACQKDKLRVTMAGPSTGRYSTVGGSISNNSMFFGSAKNATASETVVGLEVILPSGKSIKTGTNGLKNSTPFYRNHGPDLTGLFLTDNGAFGIKSAVSLKLEPIPLGISFSSFNFAGFAEMISAILTLGRLGECSECLGLGALITPDKKTNSPVLHIVIEGWTQEIADAKQIMVNQILGPPVQQIEPTIPRFMRENPFSFSVSPLDAKGRLQIWTNGMFPFDRVKQAYQDFRTIIENQSSKMREMKVDATLSFACAGNAIMVEPVLYWNGLPSKLHLNGMESIPEPKTNENNETTTKLVKEIRDQFIEAMDTLGAAHLQYGRFYSYESTLDPDTLAFIKGMKKFIDPKSISNPGVLGLY